MTSCHCRQAVASNRANTGNRMNSRRQVAAGSSAKAVSTPGSFIRVGPATISNRRMRPRAAPRPPRR